MDVNENNYEEFVLDYLDGTLPESTHRQVETFLNDNPIIREEIKDVNQYKVPLDEVTEVNKAALYRKSRKPLFYTLAVSGIAAAIAFFFAANVLFTDNQKSGPVVNKTVVVVDEPIEQMVEQPDQLVVDPTVNEPVQANANTPVLSKKSSNETPVYAKTQVDDTVQEQNVFKNQTNKSEQANDVKMMPQPTVSQSPLFTTIAETEQPKKIEPKEVNQIKQTQNVEEPQPLPVTPKKQQVIDDILKDIDFAENDKSNDGFEVETFPTEEELFTVDREDEKTNNAEQTKSAFQNAGETILDVFRADEKEIKNAILPKSFGFGDKKEQEKEDKN